MDADVDVSVMQRSADITVMPLVSSDACGSLLQQTNPSNVPLPLWSVRYGIRVSQPRTPEHGSFNERVVNDLPRVKKHDKT